ncbi:MAG: DUF1501 domain-containing protein, partial [Gemmataceae bacterium]
DAQGMPGAVRLPMQIFNTDGSIWPGQDAGFLGRTSDPWLLRCQPAAPDFQIPGLTLRGDVPLERLGERRHLLTQFDASLNRTNNSAPLPLQTQAFELLASPKARQAFQLSDVPDKIRDAYGRTHFGQSCLLARRLIEAGVGLVQVNWFRGPEEPADSPCWDSHANESQRLKTVLGPTLDRAFSALLDDLSDRGLLQDTLIACISEFGRTIRFNPQAGRDHWGHVFSVALAGGGVRGGQAYGESDKQGGQPLSGKVTPADLTATILHTLGYGPDTEFRDTLGRPHFASTGSVIKKII